MHGGADVDVGKNVVVAITSDKGLCGGINSTVCKHTRAVYHVMADEGQWPCVIWGVQCCCFRSVQSS